MDHVLRPGRRKVRSQVAEVGQRRGHRDRAGQVCLGFLLLVKVIGQHLGLGVLDPVGLGPGPLGRRPALLVRFFVLGVLGDALLLLGLGHPFGQNRVLFEDL